MITTVGTNYVDVHQMQHFDSVIDICGKRNYHEPREVPSLPIDGVCLSWSEIERNNALKMAICGQEFKARMASVIIQSRNAAHSEDSSKHIEWGEQLCLSVRPEEVSREEEPIADFYDLPEYNWTEAAFVARQAVTLYNAEANADR